MSRSDGSPLFPYLDGVVATPFDGGLVLVRPAERRLCLLNGSGAAVWRLYHGEGSVERAADLLAVAYGIGSEEAAAAVESSLAEWRSAGFLDPARPVRDRVEGSLPRPLPAPSSRQGTERSYRLGACSFRILYGAAGLEDFVHPRLEHLSAASLPGAPRIEIYAAGEGAIVSGTGGWDETADGSEAIGLVFRRIVEILHPGARWIAHLHAAAVGVGGATLLLPGAKGAGKSTLTAALVHAGAAYLSDDVVFLDDLCRAVSLPVRLALKEGSWKVVGELFPALGRESVSALRSAPVRYLDPSPEAGTCEALPRPVRAIVFPRFLPGSAASLRPVPPGEALLRLVDDRAWLSWEEEDIGAWTRWLTEVPAYSLEYSTLPEAVSLALGAAGG